jgi:periplasmic protein TonB
MSYAGPHDSGKRLTGLVVVVVFHVVLGYALVEVLARKIVEVVRVPLETKIVEEVKPPPPEKPPPPTPKLATPLLPYIPPPDVQVQMPVWAPVITAVGFGTIATGPISVPPNAGRNFSIQHGAAVFRWAMEGAQLHCVKMGLAAKHLGSDRLEDVGMISRFECVRAPTARAQL